MSINGGFEAKAAVDAFLNEFKAFQDEVGARMTRHERRVEAMDQKSMRPDLAGAADQEPHKKAIDAYLRTGDDAALRSLELKAMNTAVNADGGYLVDPQTAETIQNVLYGAGSLRSVANVVQVEANAFDVLVDKEDIGSGWTTEIDLVSETTTSAIERVSIPLHELSALPKASQRLLDDSAFDIESWLADRIADKFQRAEAAAFINGDGVDKPRGFLDHTVVSDDLADWGELGYVATGAASDFNDVDPADALVDLVYALGARYRSNAAFVMNSKTAGAVRKMKDADGRFLWADSIAAGEPSRLLGYPVVIAEDMPDIATNAYAIAFGDFAAGYTVAERPDLRVLRDPFSAKPHVLFYATKRVGGDVTDFSAIKLLKIAVS